MRLKGSSFLRMVISVSPALFILILTLIISMVTGHPNGLFLTRSTRGVLFRFLVVTLMFIAPVLILPKIMGLIIKIGKNEGIFGRFVIASLDSTQELSRLDAWILRPMQGVFLALIFAERLENLLEFLPARLVLFFIGSALVSLFLSGVWALDDMGIKIYNRRTGEVYMTGRSIGTILPLITAALGVSALFHLGSPQEALLELGQIVMVLYPSYVFLVVFHQEFIKKRKVILSGRILLERIELNLR